MRAPDHDDRPGLDPASDAASVRAAALVEDRIWSDPRSQDDRAQFHECEHCGRPIRWIENLGSELGGNLPIVARPVTSGLWFDADRHRRLIAVYPDRTGFAVARTDTRELLDGTVLYACHWDVCDDARRVRDRLSRRRELLDRAHEGGIEPDPEVVRRYDAWRRDSGSTGA